MRDGAAETLYIVGSITSYDDRIQAIGKAKNPHFGGREIRNPGSRLRKTRAMRCGASAQNAVASAPRSQHRHPQGIRRAANRYLRSHAYSALKHDYKDLPPVEHISQVIARQGKSRKLELNHVENGDNVYAYHDPCHFKRHNQIYDDRRDVLDAIPGLKRLEMSRCSHRSLCCGGGGVMLFHDPQESERMGVERVQMAAEAGANVIVSACPFCMVNIEGAIKVSGMEGKMTAIDLARRR